MPARGYWKHWKKGERNTKHTLWDKKKDSLTKKAFKFGEEEEKIYLCKAKYQTTHYLFTF